MPHIASIRQSGGSRIISIPTSILRSLHMDIDSKVEITIENKMICLRAYEEKNELSLDDVLAGSPKAKLHPTDEDRAWLSSESKGREY